MAIKESDLGLNTTQPAPAPVSLHADAPFRRVLIPLDGSELAEAVLPYVRRLAGARGSRVVLVEVVPTTPVVATIEAPTAAQVIAEADERSRAEAHAYLERIGARLRTEGIDVTPLVLVGDPADAIVEVAREHDVELIAMTTHGRTGLGRMFFGSCAEQVLRHAMVPVFLVRVAAESEARRAA